MDKPNTVTDSKIFPAGYGDFALQSSDGVVCHFPRHLLGYLSGFFKDMFELPKSHGDSQPTSPLMLTEPSETIELLLQHMDPKIMTPEINQDTIVDLLEAARKYQVPTVTAWFEQEIKFKKAPVFSEKHGPSILLEHPIRILYCAVRFNLPESGRSALRVLARCDESFLSYNTSGLELNQCLYIMSLRKKRMELLAGFAKKLAELKPTPDKPRSIYAIAHETRVTCVACAAVRASWVFSLRDAIDREPNWASFLSAYEKNGGHYTCFQCKTPSWADYYREYLGPWKANAIRIEDEVPEWPAWSS